MTQRSRVDERLEGIAEAVLGEMGFELVDLEIAGRSARPILRLRIDRLESEPGRGVTVDECAAVSRALERILDEHEELLSSYILEVSSPGVERPLRKRRDFERSVGREVALRGFGPLAGGSRRIEGVLLAVEGCGEAERLRVKLADGTEVEVLRSAVAKANLVFRWDGVEAAGGSRDPARSPDPGRGRR
jgi:ribosome maturation factor RimP